jgi:hypothetical protein
LSISSWFADTENILCEFGPLCICYARHDNSKVSRKRKLPNLPGLNQVQATVLERKSVVQIGFDEFAVGGCFSSYEGQINAVDDGGRKLFGDFDAPESGATPNVHLSTRRKRGIHIAFGFLMDGMTLVPMREWQRCCKVSNLATSSSSFGRG